MHRYRSRDVGLAWRWLSRLCQTQWWCSEAFAQATCQPFCEDTLFAPFFVFRDRRVFAPHQLDARTLHRCMVGFGFFSGPCAAAAPADVPARLSFFTALRTDANGVASHGGVGLAKPVGLVRLSRW